ncbi:hypothetical protein JXB01_03275 [Candidatus Micrarchaeota archaeon]|nr:hypothetical protein [Candidatus Micrarchaeota archaeon]
MNNLKNEIYAILILLLVIVMLLSAIHFYNENNEREDAKTFIIEDLQTKHPYADVIDIISMDKKTNGYGEIYYETTARITEDLNTPCPVRIHYYYNYPEQNFVTQPPAYITKNCLVCENVGPCIIAFEEEAIIASHTFPGTSDITLFITQHKDAYPLVSKHEEFWIVDWISPDADYSYQVRISSDGKTITKEKINA